MTNLKMLRVGNTQNEIPKINNSSIWSLCDTKDIARV